MLQMIIYSDTDVREKYPVLSQFKFLNNKENIKIAFKMSGWGTSTLANRAQIPLTYHSKGDISSFTVTSLQI